MYKIILLLHTLSFLWISSYGQKDTSQVTLYCTNGDVLTGIVNGSLFGKPHVKLYAQGTKTRISLSKLDSLTIDGQLHILSKTFLGYDILLPLASGSVNLYEVNNASLALSYKDKESMVLTPSSYNRALAYLGIPITKATKEIAKEAFISEIQKFNQQNQNPEALPMDSVLESTQFFIARISFLRPEIGAELKLTKSISLYTSVGANFAGALFRNAQTFINYDYSGEIRFFYRQQHRFNTGKINYNFSGPFLAGTYKYLVDINRTNQNFVGILHGWQKTEVLANTYIGYRIGIGYNLTQENTQFFSALTLGWTF